MATNYVGRRVELPASTQVTKPDRFDDQLSL